MSVKFRNSSGIAPANNPFTIASFGIAYDEFVCELHVGSSSLTLLCLRLLLRFICFKQNVHIYFAKARIPRDESSFLNAIAYRLS